MMTLRSCLLVVLLAGAASCRSADDPEPLDRPDQPGLAFATLPASARLNGLFQVWVRINDETGRRVDGDNATEVSIAAIGSGTLRGTLTRKASEGIVLFDDLSYDVWEPIRLAVTAARLPEARTRATIPVRPVMRFANLPSARVAASVAMGPITVELVDGQGRRVPASQPVAVTAPDAGLSVPAGAEQLLDGGAATFQEILLSRPGNRTLVFRSANVSDLVHGVTVHEGIEVMRVWLRTGRVGVPYTARLPDMGTGCRLTAGALPRGLELDETCTVLGVPTAAQHARVEISGARAEGSALLYRADLTIFAGVETPIETLDALATRGPYDVLSVDDTITPQATELSRKIRVFYPARGGQAADGAFPVVVFHHGAALYDVQHPALYDRFDHLLQHWASHGFVVVTIDGLDLVYQGRRLTNGSLANLGAMAESQRAAVALLQARNSEPDFPVAGHMDTDRVIMAGTSRGGGAAIIAARSDPSVVGGILIKPLDPMSTVGGEHVWNRPLPAKPFLILIGEDDADVPAPMVDALYERRNGPTTAVTIRGAVHLSTCAGCELEPNARPTITREQEWAVSNAYAVAFLKYVGTGDARYAPFLYGKPALSTTLSPKGVLVRADRWARALVVDDFQDDDVDRNALRLPNAAQHFSAALQEPSTLDLIRSLPDTYVFAKLVYARPEVLAQANALRLTSTQSEATYATDLDRADVRAYSAFVLRARRPTGAPATNDVSLAFVDGEGRQVLVNAGAHTGSAGVGPRFGDVIVPLADLAREGLDLGTITRIQLHPGSEETLIVDDLRFE